MSQNSISNSLLNIILVMIESVITLVLRFDPSLRRAIYPLVKRNAVVCVRTYLPHVQVYATFTNKGILLDGSQKDQNREADVVINAYSHQLLNAIVSNDVTQVNKITMRGNTDIVAEVRFFLVQLGVASLVQSIIKTVKGGRSGASKEETKPKTDDKDYKARIEEQQQQLNTLSIRNRELEITVKEKESKQKILLIALGVMTLIAIAAITGWVLS